MPMYKGYVSTDKVGSKVEFEFWAENGIDPEELEKLAQEEAYNWVSWSYWPDEDSEDDED